MFQERFASPLTAQDCCRLYDCSKECSHRLYKFTVFTVCSSWEKSSPESICVLHQVARKSQPSQRLAGAHRPSKPKSTLPSENRQKALKNVAPSHTSTMDLRKFCELNWLVNSRRYLGDRLYVEVPQCTLHAARLSWRHIQPYRLQSVGPPALSSSN